MIALVSHGNEQICTISEKLSWQLYFSTAVSAYKIISHLV